MATPAATAVHHQVLTEEGTATALPLQAIQHTGAPRPVDIRSDLHLLLPTVVMVVVGALPPLRATVGTVRRVPAACPDSSRAITRAACTGTPAVLLLVMVLTEVHHRMATALRRMVRMVHLRDRTATATVRRRITWEATAPHQEDHRLVMAAIEVVLVLEVHLAIRIRSTRPIPNNVVPPPPKDKAKDKDKGSLRIDLRVVVVGVPTTMVVVMVTPTWCPCRPLPVRARASRRSCRKCRSQCP